MDTVILNPSYRAFKFNLSNHPTCYLNNFTIPFVKFRNFNKPKTCSISASHIPHSNPQKPNSQWGKYTLPIKPFSLIVPLLHSFKDFALKTSKKHKWISIFRYNNDKCLQNGGIGMALLSVTSTAKVRISPFVGQLAANPTFVSGLFAWIVAQSIKVFLNFWMERKWDLRIMFASGGMPSSHSALCTALTTSVAICHGVADSLFPVCLGFSLIVMYDAIGVRRHAGMQAEVLNMIVADLFQGHPISQRKLKELLGHTPSQVLAGAVLGIVVACVCCQGCLVAI